MMTLKVEREQAYKEHLKTIERQNDLKILCENHAHLDEPFKSIVIEQKRAICAKWGWEMPSEYTYEWDLACKYPFIRKFFAFLDKYISENTFDSEKLGGNCGGFGWESDRQILG
ncbi:hypothetical protein Hanom_Chr14g01294721 [Helianthus anomalus]